MTNLIDLLEKKQATRAIYVFLFFFYVFFMPGYGAHYDIQCWIRWSIFNAVNGLGNAYLSDTDYMPLYQYVLYLFGKIWGSEELVRSNIKYLKVFTLLFDFIAGFLLIRMAKDRISSQKKLFFYSLLFFLNIPYLYNTLVWGQVDGILATLVLAAVIAAIEQRVSLSLVLTVCALNFKLQAIVFIPLVGLLLLPQLIKDFNLKNAAWWITAILSTQLIIVLPFVLAGNTSKLIFTVVNSFGKYPVVSMNAYNFWDWVVAGDLTEVSDQVKAMGLAYKDWGLLMFFVISFVALLPLLKAVYNHVVTKGAFSFDKKKVMLTGALISLIFFFFNTEMHERYSHPALLFIIAYTMMNKSFVPLILVCAAYVLNMEGVLRYFTYQYDTFVFNRQLVSSIYFLVILILFYDLFKKERTTV